MKVKNLRNLIDQFLSDEEYTLICDSANNLMFAVTVVDMNSGGLEAKYSSAVTESRQMKNWIWASANEPLFMSYYNVGDAAYVDGACQGKYSGHGRIAVCR